MSRHAAPTGSRTWTALAVVDGLVLTAGLVALAASSVAPKVVLPSAPAVAATSTSEVVGATVLALTTPPVPSVTAVTERPRAQPGRSPRATAVRRAPVTSRGAQATTAAPVTTPPTVTATPTTAAPEPTVTAAATPTTAPETTTTTTTAPETAVPTLPLLPLDTATPTEETP